MAEWTVTEEAVQAMTDLANRLYEVIQTILSERQQLEAAFEENKDGLGYHSANISDLLEALTEAEKSAQTQGARLALKMRRAAYIRKAHIEKEYLTGRVKDSSGSQRSPGLAEAIPTGAVAVDLDSSEYASYVLHELKALQESLELTEGDPHTLQLGGLHGVVKTDEEKKAAHFESHHIPSQGVLADDPDNLPTIAISREDHTRTDSYAGKQKKRYISMFPDVPPSDAYKAGVIKEIREGKFVDIVRNEIYNIREQFGTKYDGGIARYFEALKRYIEKNGVPKAKDK